MIYNNLRINREIKRLSHFLISENWRVILIEENGENLVVEPELLHIDNRIDIKDYKVT